MRKTVLFATVLAAVVGVTAVAFAANTYTVTVASLTPTKAGTTGTPAPVQLNFGFTVQGENNQRPTVSTDYTIGFGPGVIQNRRFFRTCTSAQAGFASGQAANCPANALVGQGRVSNEAGLAANPNQKIACNLRLRLYNGDGRYAATGPNDGRRVRADVWLVLNGGPNDPAISNCPLDVPPVAVPAQFTRYLGGTALTFHVRRVPLQEPQAGVSNAIIQAIATVNRKTTRVRTRVGTRFVFRTRGFFETTRCPAGGHPINVRFVDQQNRVTNAPTKRAPCRR